MTGAPRFERFRLAYPSGTVVESHVVVGELLETLRAVPGQAVGLARRR